MTIVATVPGWVVTIESVVSLSISLGLSLRFSNSISAPLAIDEAMAVVATVPGWVVSIESVVSLSIRLGLSLRFSLRGGHSCSKQREENEELHVGGALPTVGFVNLRAVVPM